MQVHNNLVLQPFEIHMIDTLAALKARKLIGSKTLKIACGLEVFPDEIIELADTLEVLDLTGNQISELPDSFVKLKKLRILFFGSNKFIEFPKVLAECSSLTMIGFKSNQIEVVPENAFPPKLNWLILTDNKIKKLPKSIGTSHLLQKCALAGNLLQELPAEMKNCKNLELIRVSANKLTAIPDWLFELPKLSWVAFGGNPATYKIEVAADIESFDWNDFDVQELLGEGASGFISKANWMSKKEAVAIKVFKGAVTSDGLPDDEMELSIMAGAHENLIPVLGKIKNHPEDKPGLIMKLISPDYINLGNPPSLETCTRDTFEEGAHFTFETLLKIGKSIASVSAQLHSKGINHGDLYAHNILINQSSENILGDFGAASFYDVNATVAHHIEKVEVRAFGCLLEDVLNLVREEKDTDEIRVKWDVLIASCTDSDVMARLSFSEILVSLSTF